jgi:hypothetical protein
MKRIAGFLAAFLFSATALAQVAYVHEMRGQVSALTGSTSRALAVGSTLEQGDSVATGANSTAVLKFEDGQLMVLAENTQLRIERYNFNKQRVASSNAVFELARGGLRFVTGMIGSTRSENFQIKTSSATIGVRGTDGSMYFDAVTQIVTAAVNAGALTVANSQGSGVVNVGGPLAAGRNAGPSAAALTGAVAATLNALAARTGLPVNTPIVVAASARAAAAQARATALAQAAAQNPALQAQADAAAAAAATALQAAIAAGQQAIQNAINAGGVLPPPPAPGSILGTGTSSGTTTGTGTTGSTSGSGSGSGGGGGGETGTPQ